MDKHSHVGLYITIIVCAIVSTLVSIGANIYIVMMPKIQEIGGHENFLLYSQLVGSKDYQKSVKDSLESQLKGGGQDTGSADAGKQDSGNATGTLSQDDIKTIIGNTYLKGDKAAQIYWVEYSDLECPYCKRLHDSGAIKNLEAKYGPKLAFAFKHYPLPFHANALPAANTAECVGDAKGSDAYFKFVEEIFSRGVPTQDEIDAVLKDQGLNAATIKKCVDSNKFKNRINDHQNEGSTKFSINGTPGNVLINSTTGDYEVLSGAMPEANFDSAIERLLAK